MPHCCETMLPGGIFVSGGRAKYRRCPHHDHPKDHLYWSNNVITTYHITMKQLLQILIMLALTAVFACNAKQEYQGYAAESAAGDASSRDAERAESRPEEEQASDAEIERKIIKEGAITFETADVKATRQFILAAVAESGGYLAQDNAYDYDDKLQHQLILRVPADKFDQLLDKISASAKKLDSKNISAQDVTEEFIDVQARLKTKKELEARYLELLKQAKKVDEILNIEREIGTLRSDIESIEGRLKYLSDKVSFGTLTVTYYQKTTASFGFGSKFSQALRNGWTNLGWFAIGLTSLWPFLLLGLGVFIVLRRARRKKAGK